LALTIVAVEIRVDRFETDGFSGRLNEDSSGRFANRPAPDSQLTRVIRSVTDDDLDQEMSHCRQRFIWQRPPQY